MDYLRKKISIDLDIELDKVINYTHLNQSSFSIDSYEDQYLDDIENESNLFQKERYTKATDLLVKMIINTPSQTGFIFKELDECNFSTSNENLNKFLFLIKKNNMSIEKFNNALIDNENKSLKKFVDNSLEDKDSEFSLKKLHEVIEIFKNFHIEKACSIIDRKLSKALSVNNKSEIEKLFLDWKENKCDKINNNIDIFDNINN